MPLPRHQCLIYTGSPVQHLQEVCDAICRKLQEDFRCLYLNSGPMVAGMRSYLAASGIDVAHSVAAGKLVLSADQGHLIDGRFDVDCMMFTLEDALHQARLDGFAGLWATGDMSWEFGPARDFSALVEYEHRLESFMEKNPDFGGICQYHSDTLPRECLHQALVTHRSLFVNETLSRINPRYLSPHKFTPQALADPALDAMLESILRSECAD